MLFIAAILTLILSLAHSYLGEKYIVGHIVKMQDFPAKTGDVRRTHMVIRLAWHVTSLTWLGIAGLLAYLHFDRSNAFIAVLYMVVIVFVLSGAMSLIWVKGKHLSWAFFFAIAALAAYTLFTA